MTVEANIKFIGNQINRDKSLQFVDKILREKVDFEGFEGLSKGLDDLTHEFKIQISDDDDSYSVAVEALANQGELLEFVIDKATETVYRVNNQQNFKKVNDEDIDFLDGI